MANRHTGPSPTSIMSLINKVVTSTKEASPPYDYGEIVDAANKLRGKLPPGTAPRIINQHDVSTYFYRLKKEKGGGSPNGEAPEPRVRESGKTGVDPNEPPPYAFTADQMLTAKQLLDASGQSLAKAEAILRIVHALFNEATE